MMQVRNWDLRKEMKGIREGTHKGKINSFIFIFLTWFNICVQTNNGNNILDEYSLLISEMSDINVRRDEYEIF